MGSKGSLILASLMTALFGFWMAALVSGNNVHWAGPLSSGLLAAVGYWNFFTARADERRGGQARRAIR